MIGTKILKPSRFRDIGLLTLADIDNFCLELESSIRNTEFINILNHDPNENYDKIERLVCDAKQKCMPSKLEKVKHYKHKLSPWITSGILKSIKFRDQLYKSMKLCAPDSQEYASNCINLNTCNSILQKTIRNAKKSYYRDEFEKHKNDSRKTWCTIKNLINKNKSSKEFPSYFLIDNVKETDTKIIADKFNNFFKPHVWFQETKGYVNMGQLPCFLKVWVKSSYVQERLIFLCRCSKKQWAQT